MRVFWELHGKLFRQNRMNLFLNHFYKIPSLIQILIGEFVAVFFGAGYFANFWVYQKGESKTLLPGGTGLLDICFILIVVALFAWQTLRILWPKVIKTRWRARTYIPLDPVTINIPNPTIPAIEYPFVSTHPSYLLLDLVVVGICFFIFTLTPQGPGWTFEQSRADALLVLGAYVPLLRLISWFILKRRPALVDTSQAWKPVALFVGLFLLPIFLLCLVLWYRLEIAEKKRMANLPVVSAQTFAGGWQAHLDLIDSGHFENKDGLKKVTREVRVKGIQKNSPQTCTQGPHRFATVLIDLGEGGEALVFRSNEEADKLVKLTQNQEGKPIELTGRLRNLPRLSEVPPWQNICGLGELDPPPPSGRLLLKTN